MRKLNEEAVLNYMDITYKITSRIPLKRVPTNEDLEMIRQEEMFDIEDLFDWNRQTTENEDYSSAKIEVVVNNKKVLFIRGKY